MPTKRTFDLIVLTVLFTHGALGLAKIWAGRISADPNEDAIKNTVAGAVSVVA